VRLDASFFQDPHAVYAALRETGPVRQVVLPHGWQTWIVTRYEDARAALADPRLRKDGRKLADYMDPETLGEDTGVFAEALRAHMLNTDPPDHTRLRRLVTKAFTHRRIQALRPRIEAITDSLLDDLAAAATAPDGTSKPIDLIESFAFPLPLTVICELLGVPTDDRADFRRWTTVVVADDAPEDELRSASHAMAGYLSQLLAEKRRRPADDLLTALTQARDEDDRLDEQELISMTFLLLVAGHETTVNLIGNGLLALLDHPEQLERLREDPSLVPAAVEEFLRYDGPVNLATMRFTTEPVELGGVEIPSGQFVLVSLAGANRDAERFPEPDRFDVTRQASGHVAFGHGIHFCLGAPLARLEGEVAFTRLLARYPKLRLAGAPTELRWRESSLIRGLEVLPLLLW
jgi:cytochrome P450